MRAAWEQRADETARAFTWFAKYRSLPAEERSIVRLVSDDVGRQKNVGRTATTGAGLRRRLEKWSAKHDWQARVAAWDGRVDQRVQEEQLADAAAAAKRHGLIARVMLDATSLPVRLLLTELRERLADPVRAEELRREVGEVETFALLDRLERIAPGRSAMSIAEGERAAMAAYRIAARAEAEAAAHAAREAAMRGEPVTSEDMWLAINRVGAVASILDQVGGLKPDQAELGRWARERWPDA
jgi:hypothetical protein